MSNAAKPLHRIVIVGGGAGGLILATKLGRKLGKRKQAEIILVDSNLTHLWKPLLHEVAAGSMNANVDELNYLALAKWNHFQFQLGRMNGLNREQKTISLSAMHDENGQELVPERSLSYDSLVVAIGSNTNDFGTPGAAEHCLFLDSPKQAQKFHKTFLNQYLQAAAKNSNDGKMQIAIVGAGATGVELAAELHEAARTLNHYGLSHIDAKKVEITIIEGGNRVLPALPERVSGAIARKLDQLGVKVMTQQLVNQITADALYTKSGEEIPAQLKVWAAGIKAPEFLQQLDGLETNRMNQLTVRPTLQTTLDDSVFALGDCADCTIPDAKGNPYKVPPRAQAAHQQASMLAKALTMQLQGKPLPEYTYNDYGSLISLSDKSAVGNLMGKIGGDVMLEGKVARWFYISLYRMHQMSLYGTPRTMMLILKDLFGKGITPKLKLH